MKTYFVLPPKKEHKNNNNIRTDGQECGYNMN